jgi:diguanylate cyclase (GGDEF)-like protein
VNKYIFVLLTAIMVGAIFINLKVKANDTKRILFISSYEDTDTPSKNRVEGIKAEIQYLDVLFDEEYMDFERVDSETNVSNSYSLLKNKIAQKEKYDLVIVDDKNVLDFLIQYNKELFNSIPVVFIAKDPRVKNMTILDSESTVDKESLHMLETIEDAIASSKNAKKIIAILDVTEKSEKYIEVYNSIENEFPNYEFSNIDLSSMTFEEFYEKIRQIDKDDIVLLISAYIDKVGNKIDYDKSLELIYQNCNSNIFNIWDKNNIENIFDLKSFGEYEEGREAGRAVLSLLKEGILTEYPLLNEKNNDFKFDLDELRKNNLDALLLPRGIIVIDKKISFYQKNKMLVNIGIIIFAFLSALIIFLIIYINNRKKYEKDLLKKNQELNEAYNKLEVSEQELKRQYIKIQRYAYYDTLTSLPNRTSLKIKLRNLTRNKNNKYPLFALVYLDLDNFKFINDSYGHSVGDKVLKEIGNVLIGLELGEFSTFRLGGDEFALVLEDIRNYMALYDKIDSIRKSLDKSMYIEGSKYFITTSIGVSVYPENGKNYSELLKNADAAMYKAKELGRNCSIFYDESINAKLSRTMDIRSELLNALSNKEFFLNYQPQVDIKSGIVYGFEALIRWINPTLGFVSPGEFIEVAEEMGVIVQIGNWVLEEACKFCKKINEKNQDKLVVSVNVSAVQLMQEQFVKNVISIIEKTKIDPNFIAIEITETAILNNFDLCIGKLEQLKSMGIKVSLDDFGKGYSSLYYLRNLPIDTLKIDKTFIDDMIISDNMDKEKNKDLTESIILISHKLGLKVVAEGVEMPIQLIKLKDYQCNFVQGYYISKPMDENKVWEFFENFRNNKGEYEIWN